MEKWKGKYTGWGKKYFLGQPTKEFTREEFNKSHIKKNFKISYKTYLKKFETFNKPQKKIFFGFSYY